MELHRLSATELLAQLQAGRTTSLAIVEALIARGQAVDGRLKAMTHRFDQQARAAAQDADEARKRGISYGPLHGLPVTVKESIHTAGLPTTLGVRAQADTPATDDAVVVKLLRRVGAIVIGKTNISQTLLFNEADNPVYGRTVNPFARDRVPGGSSGGEAAALAAGLTPFGVGTDIGGSIRVPAAYCGVAGLKPTVDRWSMVGCKGAMPGQESIRSQVGPMARTAADVALLFGALDGPSFHDLDPTVPPLEPGRPHQVDIRNLTIGWYDDDGFFPASPAVRRGVRQAAEALARAGARVVPYQVPHGIELTYLYFAILSSDGGRTLEKLLKGDPVVPQLAPLRMMSSTPQVAKEVLAAFLGSQGEARLERFLRTIGTKNVTELWALVAERLRLRLATLEAWEEQALDVVIGPPHATPALRHGQSKDFSLGGCYSMLYNTLNFPAGVVPVSTVTAQDPSRPTPRDRLERVASEVDAGSVGLPVAVQVAARPYREDLVLATMMAIEAQVRGHPDFPQTPIDPRP